MDVPLAGALETLSIKCPLVTKLTIHDANITSRRTVSALAALPSLTDLELYDSVEGERIAEVFEMLRSANMTRLKSLSLDNSQYRIDTSDEDAMHIVSFLSSLNKLVFLDLHLENCGMQTIEDETISTLASLSHLRDLTLRGSGSGEQLSRLTQLSKLSIYCYVDEPDDVKDVMKSVSSLTQLRSLAVILGQFPEPEIWENVESYGLLELAPLTNLTSLTINCMTTCCSAFAHELATLLQHGMSLSYLNIRHCRIKVSAIVILVSTIMLRCARAGGGAKKPFELKMAGCIRDDEMDELDTLAPLLLCSSKHVQVDWDEIWGTIQTPVAHKEYECESKFAGK